MSHMKSCAVCNQDKAPAEFYASQKYTCKTCCLEQGRQWRAANRERHNAAKKAYRKLNPRAGERSEASKERDRVRQRERAKARREERAGGGESPEAREQRRLLAKAHAAAHSRSRYWENHEIELQRRAKVDRLQTEKLLDCYVRKKAARLLGCKPTDIDEAITNAKREALMLHRLARTMRQQLTQENQSK